MSDAEGQTDPSGETEALDLGQGAPERPPVRTGDADADAVLERLWRQDRTDPQDELTAFRDALEELTGLTQDHPRLPGTP